MTEVKQEFDVTTGGYKTKVVSGDTIAIDVERKKSSFASGFGRVIGFTIGGLGIFLGALLCITIIGALIGFPMMIVSVGIIYMALGKQKLACPHCAKKQPVVKTAMNFTCAKCKQLTVVNWH